MSPPAAATKEVPQQETPERRKARIDGIKKLIQQASSNVRPEAEQAAYRACALIRKFGLDVVDPALLDSIYAENHRLKAELDAAKTGSFDAGPLGGGRASVPPSSGFPSSGFSGFQTQHVSTASSHPSYAQPQYHANPSPPMVSPQFLAKSKFAGKCKQCGKVLNVDDPVHWIKKVGIWCGLTTCYQLWRVNQSPPYGP